MAKYANPIKVCFATWQYPHTGTEIVRRCAQIIGIAKL